MVRVPRERGDEPEPPKALAVALKMLDTHGRRIEELRGALEQETAARGAQNGALKSTIDQLVALMTDEGVTEQEEGQQGKNRPASWIGVNDPDEAEQLIKDAGRFAYEVFAPSVSEAERLELHGCWPWHPALVDDFLALRTAWIDAYESKDPRATSAIEWRDRWLPGVLTRARHDLSRCSAEEHYVIRFGGEKVARREGVPYDTEQIIPMARWWAETHGGSGSGAPPGLIPKPER